MAKLSLSEMLNLIDNKFLKKLEKVTRYNPDPFSMEEPMNGESVAPMLVAMVKDKHFIKVMKSIGLYNAILVKYENHIWQFLFRFVDDFRVEIEIPKHLVQGGPMVYETAVASAVKRAVHHHEERLTVMAELQKQRVDDIVYDEQ